MTCYWTHKRFVHVRLTTIGIYTCNTTHACLLQECLNDSLYMTYINIGYNWLK